MIPNPSHPVDPDLTPRARALFDALHRVSGEFTMLGHQDDTFSAHARERDGSGSPTDSDVLAVAGAYPAVWGFDLGRIELGWSVNIDGVPFDDIRREMRRAYAMGAVVTASWHAVNPVTGGGYGENTAPGSVAAVLHGGDRHGEFLGWLRRVAAFLGSVTDEHGEPIPVVFRPYHEHTGDWFWWCVGSPLRPTDTGAGRYAELWRMTVGYLRDECGVHNVLYAYAPDRSRIDMATPASREHGYLFGYPGDGYIDVLGVDDYWDFGRGDPPATPRDRHADLVDILTLVGRLAAEHGKLAAATEIGSPGAFAAESAEPWSGYLLSALTANDDARRMLWCLPWRNSADAVGTTAYGTPAPDSPYAADFRAFVRDGAIRLADTLPPLYSR